MNRTARLVNTFPTDEMQSEAFRTVDQMKQNQTETEFESAPEKLADLILHRDFAEDSYNWEDKMKQSQTQTELETASGKLADRMLTRDFAEDTYNWEEIVEENRKYRRIKL